MRTEQPTDNQIQSSQEKLNQKPSKGVVLVGSILLLAGGTLVTCSIYFLILHIANYINSHIRELQLQLQNLPSDVLCNALSGFFSRF